MCQMLNFQQLLRQVLVEGVDRPDRTDVGSSRFIPGAHLQWNLQDGFPIITCRRVALRIAFEETMFFFRGDVDTTKLVDKNIRIWEGNTTREFLDAQGLHDLPVGSLGKGYSHQWRNFGGDLDAKNGIDQVKEVVEALKDHSTSRRHVISAWNPCQLHETPLPPCHLMHMYTVDPVNKLLHSSFVMRSNDIYHGLPYNIMGYALLNEIFAKYAGLTPGTLTYFGHDAHVYANHIEASHELLERRPKTLPKLVINKELNTFEDILSLEFSDIELVGYDPHPPQARLPMAV